MKKIYIILMLSFFIVANNVSAEDTFAVSLKYGSSGNSVISLQNFLVTQGYLKESLVTGRFLSLTKKAVMDFQKANGIISTGYFGPITRAVANQKMLASTQKPSSTISAISVTSERNTASLIMSNYKKISWQTNAYPAGAGVDINLIQKVSDNPVSYKFVEKIAQNTANDGTETWIPKSNQNGNDLYIEVTCSSSYKFTTGCSANTTPVKAF